MVNPGCTPSSAHSHIFTPSRVPLPPQLLPLVSHNLIPTPLCRPARRRHKKHPRARCAPLSTAPSARCLLFPSATRTSFPRPHAGQPGVCAPRARP
eukprot:21895-Chlamydomonas_euryale.AAC.3